MILPPGVELLGHPLEVDFRVEPQPDGWDVILRRPGEQKRFPFKTKREALQFAAFCAAELAKDLEIAARQCRDRPAILLPSP